jgi:S1-C subfamily serine protease
MKRRLLTPLAVVLAMALVPALAGEYGKKCTASTQECLDKMAGKLKSTGWIGVELDKEKVPGQYLVTRIFPGSPAEASGIQEGDVLYALNGIVISDENKEALHKAKKDWAPGQKVTYTIKRGGQEKQVALALAPMPADVIARYVGEHMLEHATTDVAAK